MSHEPSGEGPYPEHDPNQPPPPYGQASTPPHSDPYAPQPGSPGEPYGQQPGYPPPSYPQGGHPGYPQPPGTNVMAILSLILAFVFAPAGIVLGHLAKKQIAQTGEQGSGLATAGLVLSYIFTALYLLACCGIIVLAIWSGSQDPTTY